MSHSQLATTTTTVTNGSRGDDSNQTSFVLFQPQQPTQQSCFWTSGSHHSLASSNTSDQMNGTFQFNCNTQHQTHQSLMDTQLFQPQRQQLQSSEATVTIKMEPEDEDVEMETLLQCSGRNESSKFTFGKNLDLFVDYLFNLFFTSTR